MKRLPLYLGVLTVLMLLGLAAGWLFMPATIHYHLFADEPSLNSVLARQVQPWDSTARVVRLLGAGTPISETERQRLLRVIAGFQRQSAAGTPAGVERDDQFLGYEASGMTIYLQFRNDRLINFQPQDFEHPADLHMTHH